MQLSAPSRFALRVLRELARAGETGPLPVALLARSVGVSTQFVEQILKPLRNAGVTRGVRGAGGGYLLDRPLRGISLGEIVRLMEDGVTMAVCCGDKANECPRDEACATRRAWDRISRQMEEEMEALSLDVFLREDFVCHRENAPAVSGTGAST
ncbi:MAG: Rrf2 family transcriptional regulator [Desulfovibrio sp.]|jgi:Rrf2 family protein|nr:Rrf2 family transcriptional regulator [Desulfovibrio sp.]